METRCEVDFYYHSPKRISNWTDHVLPLYSGEFDSFWHEGTHGLFSSQPWPTGTSGENVWRLPCRKCHPHPAAAAGCLQFSVSINSLIFKFPKVSLTCIFSNECRLILHNGRILTKTFSFLHDKAWIWVMRGWIRNKSIFPYLN